MIKKLFKMILIIVLTFTICATLEAKTLRQLETELNQKLKEEENKEKEIKLTDKEIRDTKTRIQQIYGEIADAEIEIKTKTKEIEQLNINIKSKDEEIKKLMKFFQISKGNSALLEYLTGAQTLTDFIYRIAIVEQLSKHNAATINNMNDMIKENERNKKELLQKEIDLAVYQEKLAKNLISLENSRVSLSEEAQSLVETIKNSQSVIKMYRNAGCKLDDDISVCASKQLPPDTSFWRPLQIGYITSEYGARTLRGKYNFHAAVDIGNRNDPKSNIYASAGGKVAKVIRSNIGGGNQIIIHHNINGSYYTTYYAHLSSINVNQGALVTKDTVIGLMGNTGNSYGSHLHIGVARGLWYSQYVSYGSFISKSIDPRSVINFPKYSGTWLNRTTKY